MAKALYGHLTAADPRLVAEVARLRRRIAELEAENADLRAGLELTVDLPVDISDGLFSRVTEPVSV